MTAAETQHLSRAGRRGTSTRSLTRWRCSGSTRATQRCAVAVETSDRRARARAARRDRQPGAARDHERRQLRDARANVPLDRRGARQRARGEGLVHVVARALDLRHGDRGRPRARPRRRAAQARRARRALPRHRQDRDPRLDPHEAGAADRRGACADRAASRARRADPCPDRAARGGQADRPGLPRALRRRWATRTASPPTRSRSRRGSSSPATPSTR